MNKKLIFLLTFLLVSSCGNSSENTIEELEEQIIALESKEDLSPEEIAELDQLIEEQDQLIEDQVQPVEEDENLTNFEGLERRIQELENQENLSPEEEQELELLKSELYESNAYGNLSKYRIEPDVDPNWKRGTFLARHCQYFGYYGGEFYEETPLTDVPLTEDQRKEYYIQGEKLSFSSNDPEAIKDEGEIKCAPDWGMEEHFPTSLDKSEDAPQQYYGLSFYDRIFPVDYHTGLFGHWLQAPNSHPAVGISSIEGGLGHSQKFGRSKYLKFMANSATHFYNPNSSLFGYGFYERRVSCCYLGGIQISNIVLDPPNQMGFDEDQPTYENDGGLYFGHAWVALPMFDPKQRDLEHAQTLDSGKLTWTFFVDTAQYSGPIKAYVPEYWYRRIDRWNALEVLLETEFDQSIETTPLLIDYLGGRVNIDSVMSVLKQQGWYADSVDEHNEGPYWVKAKDTFAFNPPDRAAIGPELPKFPVFREFDDEGNVYIKIFPHKIPSQNNLEPFIMDAKTYDVGLYNNFVDYFNGDKSINEINTDFDRFSTPITYDNSATTFDIPRPEGGYEFGVELMPGEVYGSRLSDLHLSMPITGKTTNGEATIYFDWKGLAKDERGWSTYYKAQGDGESMTYFTPVSESEVPEKLRALEPSDIEHTVSYIPHEFIDEQEENYVKDIKENTDSIFGTNSNPVDFSCWDCDSNPGCDPTIYETVLDDGTIIQYRWYRFRDQPTFQELIADYPEIYTEEYLNNIQLKIEEMHRVWGAKQPFMETPTSLGEIHLVELDNGIILTPPEGKEYGWVPIALGAETPYGKWQTELDFLWTEDAGLGTIADY